MSDSIDGGRRKFLKASAVTAAALPLATLLHQGTVKAKSKAEEDHAHDYVNDAADADHDRYQDGQKCSNCVFWEGEEEDGWGSCSHPSFSDVLVNAEGWCSVYAPAG